MTKPDEKKNTTQTVLYGPSAQARQGQPEKEQQPGLQRQLTSAVRTAAADISCFFTVHLPGGLARNPYPFAFTHDHPLLPPPPKRASLSREKGRKNDGQSVFPAFPFFSFFFHLFFFYF